MYRRRSGFTLIELLLSMLIVVMLLPVEISIMRFFTNHDYFKSDMQDDINLAQLRRVLNVCYGKRIEDNTLYCTYNEEDTEFRYNGSMLYAVKGTWIFLTEVDSLEWLSEEGLIKLRYCRSNQCRKAVLALE